MPYTHELLNLIRKHGFVMRIASHEWLLKMIDRNKWSGRRLIELWGHRVFLHWRRNGEKYILIITNMDRDP